MCSVFIVHYYFVRRCLSLCRYVIQSYLQIIEHVSWGSVLGKCIIKACREMYIRNYSISLSSVDILKSTHNVSMRTTKNEIPDTCIYIAAYYSKIFDVYMYIQLFGFMVNMNILLNRFSLLWFIWCEVYIVSLKYHPYRLFRIINHHEMILFIRGLVQCTSVRVSIISASMQVYVRK